MPLSRRLAENWKNGGFWKVLVINRTYWLQDQSYAPVAQLVAQRTLNPWVEGSSPSWGTTTGCSSVWLERLIWDQEVVGSNPTSPILFKNSSNLKTIDFSLMRRAGNWLQVWLRHRRALQWIANCCDLVKNSEWCRLRGRCTENSFLWVAADGWWVRADCKSVALTGFGGPNPSPPTNGQWLSNDGSWTGR